VPCPPLGLLESLAADGCSDGAWGEVAAARRALGKEGREKEMKNRLVPLISTLSVFCTIQRLIKRNGGSMY
jgi:hypothetical protein